MSLNELHPYHGVSIYARVMSVAPKSVTVFEDHIIIDVKTQGWATRIKNQIAKAVDVRIHSPYGEPGKWKCLMFSIPSQYYGGEKNRATY